MIQVLSAIASSKYQVARLYTDPYPTVGKVRYELRYALQIASRLGPWRDPRAVPKCIKSLVQAPLPSIRTHSQRWISWSQNPLLACLTLLACLFPATRPRIGGSCRQRRLSQQLRYERRWCLPVCLDAIPATPCPLVRVPRLDQLLRTVIPEQPGQAGIPSA